MQGIATLKQLLLTGPDAGIISGKAAMVTVVLVLNSFIALFGFYVAWRLWQLRVALTHTTEALTAAERATQRVLSRAPQTFHNRQRGLRHLRQHYRRVGLHLQRVEQLLAILGLSQAVWQWYRRRPGRFVIGRSSRWAPTSPISQSILQSTPEGQFIRQNEK